MSQQKIELKTEEDRKNYAGKVFMLIMDNLTCVDHWGFYLVNENFDSEPELRNRIGAIWFSSLYDSIEGLDREMDGYKLVAEEHHLENIKKWCSVTTEFIESIADLLSEFSKIEQLFIQDFRDGLVHSWLHKRHQQEFNVRFFKDHELVREKIKGTEYFGLIRPLYAQGFDIVLTKLRERFSDQKLDYWKKANFLYKAKDLIAKEIYSDIGVDY